MRDVVIGQGSNSNNLRRFNERVILTALRRHGSASKADLARYANLTFNTAGVIVRELQALRLVRVDGKRKGMRGQPASVLRLNADGAYSIGVKVGRRSLETILVDFSGRVLAHSRCERAFPQPEVALEILLDQIAAARSAIPDGAAAHLTGLGVATPYNLGSWRRELDIPSASYQAWNEFDLASRLGAATRLPVFVENDGTAAAAAELFMGAGRELDNFLYIFIGTSIGGGVVLAGDYYRGANGNAGDIGLMPVAPSRLTTAPRPERSHDVLLTRASISSLIRHLRGNGVPVENRSELDAAMLSRRQLVEEWLDDCADALVAPVFAAARVLDLDIVVVDGDLPNEIIDDLLGALARRLVEDAPEARVAPKLSRGRVGRLAAAIGAAILPLHLNFGPSRDILIGSESRPEQLRRSA